MKHRDLPAALPALLSVVLFCTACGTPEPPPGSAAAGPPVQVPAPDDWPTDGWRTSTPEEQGMDSAGLARVLATLREDAPAIDSVLVVRNGSLVLEAYVHPYGPDDRHSVYSVTKSVVSALTGLAIENGSIENVDQKVLSFFPERQVANRDARKEAMTVEHLLTMTAGFECEDSVEHGLRDLARSDDWVQYVLDQPMVHEPGKNHVYCNEAAFLLGAIVEKATGTPLLEFSRKNLFEPLGISDVAWRANPDGIYIGASEMEMLPSDMAKLGLLYLQRGRWDGAQVLPAAWVETSLRWHVDAANWSNAGYGYLWYMNSPGITARLGLSEYVRVHDARGYGGQLIFVVPEKNMVVVFTSWLAGDAFMIPFELLHDEIIPAAVGPEPLAADPEAAALLASHVDALANPRPVETLPALPAKASEVSGATYRMDENAFGWQDFALTFREEDALFEQTIGGRPSPCTVGLDGLFRIVRTDGGAGLACRGRWTDDETFVLDWMRMGETQRYELTFTFDGEGVRAVLSTSLRGKMPPVTGRRR